MKIISLNIQSFGKLHNCTINFYPDVNIIQKQNGFGKTTVASFVRAMLYGLKRGRTQSVGQTVNKWTDWSSNSKAGGEMVVEKDGVIYRIERHFGASAREDYLSFTEQKTGKAVDTTLEVGEYLLGLTAESYDRSAYFPQESVEMESNQNFDAKLAGLVNNTENTDKVTERLRKFMKERKAERGNGGTIYQLQLQQQDLQRKFSQAQAQLNRKDAIEKQLQSIAKEMTSLEESISALEKEKEKLHGQLAHTQLTARQQEQLENYRTLKQSIASQGNFEADKKQCDEIAEKWSKTPVTAKPQGKLLLPLLIVGILLLCAGVGVCFANIYAGIGICIAGVIALAFCYRPTKGVQTLQAGEREHLQTDYFRIAGRHINCQNKSFEEVQTDLGEAYVKYRTAIQVAKALEEALPKSNDSSELQQRLDSVKQTQEEKRRRLSELNVQRGSLAEENKNLNVDIVSIEEELGNVQLKIKAEQHNYLVAQKTLQLLEQAKDNLSTSYLPVLSQRCQQLLCEVTANDFQVVCDRNFSVKLSEKGVTQPLEYFSRGVREITLLCFRIALSELLFGREIPFLIIDDAFVNFDEDNFVRATDVVKNLCKRGTQVVYFTCHNRLGNLKT